MSIVLSVDLKWRSDPISERINVSENWHTLTAKSREPGTALGNVIMKKNSGTYHAKFCYKLGGGSGWELVKSFLKE